MRARTTVLALTIVALAAPHALAQDDDDLLAPLTPTPSKKAKPAKKKPRPPRSTTKPAQKAPPVEDDLVAPLTLDRTELLVKLVGSLKGARLFVDDREVGTLPGPAVVLPPGEHGVLVKRLGYADFSRTVIVREGQTTEVPVLLEPIAGVLAVNASVPGAQVLVDGQLVGLAPLRDAVIAPGTREVAVVADGYAKYVSRLAVKPGKDYLLQAELQPPRGGDPVATADRPERRDLAPSAREGADVDLSASSETVEGDKPWFSRWYVWAGAAAVVTGAVVGGVVAYRSSPGPKDPAQVCAPQSCDAVLNALVPIRY